MNKEFCIHCGQKNMFDLTRPKFCASCGLPFNRSSTTSQSKVVAVNADEGEEEDEDSCSFSSININKLKDTFACEMDRHKVSLDHIWSNPSPYEKFERPSHNGPDGDELLKQIQRECSSSRMQDIGDE